jgi:hypothetical protein
MIRKVEQTDILARSNMHGIIGFGLPDSYGDYDKSFLRMVQEELDLSYPTLMISFMNNSKMR